MRKTYISFSAAATTLWIRRNGTLRSALAHGSIVRWTSGLMLVLAGSGCRDSNAHRLFDILPAEKTGVTFANTITTSDSLNVRTDAYIYNGAGVAAGDIDNDGLPDLFFSGNMVSSRLYLNKGQMRFDDITKSAGVATNRWATGATMVDINNDGYLDIYVSVSGPPWSKGDQRANLLFVNNRNRTFTEEAARYGIADTGFTTHAVFLDYNRDGCLDLFLLNNSPKDFTRTDVAGSPTGARGTTPDSYNELYRSNCHGGFTNVSVEAGILREAGYGLGVAVADLNRDGWPDIYVSNDITPNDVIYVNNKNGTFTNKAAEWLKHSSFAGMGVDIADFNDDGWPDVLQVDMLPRDLSERKKMSGFATYSSQLDARARGFRTDYTANSLQLSNGVTDSGDVVFSDIASLAGIAATDWSWSPLFADFDNDGYKDIFISNGYPKAVIDYDYRNAMAAARRGGGGDTSAARRAQAAILDRLYSYNASNYFFRNDGNLTFTDETKNWGAESPGFSYGAAYVDLDNDGRLDLVVNNIDAPALIYHNVAPADEQHHFLDVRLRGAPPNILTGGIGASLTLWAGGKKQYSYCSPYRGYMSTVDDRVHFGVGAAAKVDSLQVTWPDGRQQVLKNLVVDRVIDVKETDATQPGDTLRSPSTTPAAGVVSSPTERKLFEPLDSRGTLSYKPPPSGPADYGIQALLPYAISKHGPALAVGDVNGDGLDDLYIGGGAGVAGQLLIQQKDGRFIASNQGQPWEADKQYEDWGALFFDANGDGLPDLYVASGGYQLAPSSDLLQDRLYINKGGGRFVRDPQALPQMLTSTASVRAGDFNGDGKLDLFVGGRLTPRSYPTPTRSYVLRNDGAGRFIDVTEQVLPELVRPGGMVTDGAWVDFDGDGHLDLVTVGEWMPIQFYRNDGKRFRNVTASTTLPPARGWWYALAVGDFDNDGRPDLVAGNVGLNYAFSTSRESPFGIYAANFSGSRTPDVVLTTTIDSKEYPIYGLAPLGHDIYTLGINFPTYGSFAEATVEQLFGADQLRAAVHYQADTFASVYLHNEGAGHFAMSPLPNLAQIAPIKGLLVHDVDGDGHLDLIVAGNMYDTEPNIPRLDAGNGLWLRGDGKGRFTPVPPQESGFLTPGDVSVLALVRRASGDVVIVGNAGDSLQAFAIRRP
jgi:enediyne biosynthesis protein E4